MRSRLAVAAVLLVPALVACGDAGRPAPTPAAGAGTWREVAPGDLTDAQKAQRAKADDARQALFGFLMARLQKEIAAGGPAAAVTVCRTEAAKLASDVAVSKGVAIGRTSFALRNPKNTPPAWAAPYVAGRRDQPAVLAHDDGRLALLHPIRLMKACLVCHGDAASIDPKVAEVLAKEYPGDQATGFAEDALRGWFWVEVPSP